jgi:hypothetical protein
MTAPNVLPTLQAHLDATHPLPADAVAAFQRDGHCLIPALLPEPHLAPVAAALRRTAAILHRETRPLEDRDTYGKAFLQAVNLWRVDPLARRLVLARRCANLAARLLGVPRVRLWHDQALFTEAGGGATPWHQDQAPWPFTAPALTLWLALVDLDEAMGTLAFVPGSHRLGNCADLPIGDDSQQVFARLIAERALPVVPTGPMRAGDATFHLGWTIHGAPANTSPRVREAMTVIYVADPAPLVADHPLRAASLALWCPRRVPGDPLDGDLHPLLAT